MQAKRKQNPKGNQVPESQVPEGQDPEGHQGTTKGQDTKEIQEPP